MLEQSLLVLISAYQPFAYCVPSKPPLNTAYQKGGCITLYNYVFIVFNNSSPLTLRLIITYNRHSTVFSLTKTEERLKDLSKKLHHVYFR